MFHPNPQAVPTWDNPIEMLFACHGKVKQFCHQLSVLPDYVAQNGVNTTVREAVQRIQTYFNQAAPLHHADEEQDFFPALLRHAPHVQAEIDELARQHVVLHKNWENLCAQLNALLAGERADLAADAITRFTESYDKHIAIEEPLFELGSEILPRTTQQAMGKIMAKRRGTKV